MFCSAEEEKRISAELEIMRSGQANDRTLCQHKNVSCVRCCLPHIGGDSYLNDCGAYRGPRGLVMKFKNFNPLKDPKIDASQYEDSFPDAGKEEMERRFLERQKLFLENYDWKQPRGSLSEYMKAAQNNEGYKYMPSASAGPASMFSGGSISKTQLQKGEMPECQLLGFVDRKKAVGCMAHPLAETSRGYDGRDQAGFFHHTGCCRNVGCEASKEFTFLSASAIKVFDTAVGGMSWYEYSRHATSVLVYYLRAYDHLIRRAGERHYLDAFALEHLVEFTNNLYNDWPLKISDLVDSVPMNSLEILSTDIPLTERIMYIALDTAFLPNQFTAQLQQARAHIEKFFGFFKG